MFPSYNTSGFRQAASLALLAGAAVLVADPAIAQQAYNAYYAVDVAQQTQPLYNGYSSVEVAQQGQQPLLFGVAAYKICQLKTFLFAAVYVLAAIAFVVFAVRALFTKFEVKHFIPIIAAIFVVASADLFIAWMSPAAFYCPTTMSMMTNG